MEIQELLERLKEYHPETYEHSLRVSELCVQLGKINNLNEKEIELLKTAGLLHDIGKLEIPLEILNKNSELNGKEWKIMEEHPSNGMLKDFEEVKDIVEHHHKHQRESYPKKINGIKPELCKLAQIVAVCDMFDALKNKRSYKENFSKEKIKKILEKEFTGDKIYIEQVISLD